MVIYLISNITMIRITITVANAHLSRYLGRVERGDTILLCRRNVPVAEIRPLPKPPAKPRPLGIDHGMMIPPSFFEPLPQHMLDAFQGDAPPQ